MHDEALQRPGKYAGADSSIARDRVLPGDFGTVEIYGWESSGKPVVVQMRLQVVEQLKSKTSRALSFSAPVDIAGILIGRIERGAESTLIAVDDFEVARYVSEEQDSPFGKDERVVNVVRNWHKRSGTNEIVGFFRSQRKGWATFDPADVKGAKRLLKRKENIFLRIRPATNGDFAGTLFLRLAGSRVLESEYGEFPFDGERLRAWAEAATRGEEIEVPDPLFPIAVEQVRDFVPVELEAKTPLTDRIRPLLDSLAAMAGRFHGMARELRDLHLRDLFPAAHRVESSVAPGFEEVISITEEPAHPIEEAAPAVRESAPAIEEPATITEDAATLTEEAMPITVEAIAMAEEAAPLTEEAISLSEEAVTITEEAIPLFEEAVTITEEAVPLSEEASPASEEEAPLTEEAVPAIEEEPVPVFALASCAPSGHTFSAPSITDARPEYWTWRVPKWATVASTWAVTVVFTLWCMDARMPAARTPVPEPSKTAATSNPLDLQVRWEGKLLEVGWDGSSSTALTARAGMITIRDGVRTDVVRLDGEEIRTGRIYYLPKSADLRVRLALGADDSGTVAESVRVIGSTQR